jgi:gentisate 1,2-dioxygenase
MPSVRVPPQEISSSKADGFPSVTNVKELLHGLEAIHASPLWAQMAKLNPAAPNPTSVPFKWEYEKIRPYLMSAGQLITEKQAERRVLMLVNPARST